MNRINRKEQLGPGDKHLYSKIDRKSAKSLIKKRQLLMVLVVNYLNIYS
jgi:hypothetical protein